MLVFILFNLLDIKHKWILSKSFILTCKKLVLYIKQKKMDIKH